MFNYHESASGRVEAREELASQNHAVPLSDNLGSVIGRHDASHALCHDIRRYHRNCVHCVKVLGQVRLLFSRQCQRQQAWSFRSLRSRKKLNFAYMRVFNRITAKVRFHGSRGMSGLQVCLPWPPSSGDLHISVAPHVLGGISHNACLTAPCDDGRPLLAMNAAGADSMKKLKRHHPFKLGVLADPETDHQSWVHLIVKFPPKWKQLVSATPTPLPSLSHVVTSHMCGAGVFIVSSLPSALWTCTSAEPMNIARLWET